MVASAVSDMSDALPEEHENTPPSEDCYVFPASFAQQRLWVLDQLQPGTATYNMAMEVRLSGPLDAAALADGLNALVERHESLRTTLITEDGQPMQRIASALHIPLPLVDLLALSPGEREERAAHIANAEAQLPFDLAAGPLLRVMLLRLGTAEHTLLVVMHHTISDGWSTGVLLRELGALYAAQVTQTPADLPEPAIQYADFSQWQREWLQGEVLQKQLTYWREQLIGAPAVLELPADRPRPSSQTYRGAMYRFHLPAPLTAELRRLSQREGVTLFMALLAAFQTLLARYTAQDDVVVGSAIAGRTRPETEGLIGFFVNTLVLRTDLSGDPTFRDALRRVREVAIGAYGHQDVPFERLVEELRPVRDPRYNPLFQTMFILQNALAPTDPCAGVTFQARWLDTGTSKFDLTLNVMESADTLDGWYEYSTDLFDEDTIIRMGEHYRTLLEGIVANPAQRLSALPLLTPGERRRILTEWNLTESEYPAQSCIHQLFEAQVEYTPNAVAVVHEGAHLTYRELDQRANQLANFLREVSAGAELRVGVCIERSLNMVVALLGILKAGGAYVPLDPAYPRERLVFMLQDSQAPVLITQARLLDTLPVDGIDVVCLDKDWPEIAQRSTMPPACEVTAEGVAYVTYTSGSTGTPKGVLGTHRASVNRCLWMWHAYPFGADEVCCQKTALSFVDSVWEIFGPLLQGIPTVLIPDEVVKDPWRLIEALAEARVTRIVLVPSLLRVLLESDRDLHARLPRLKYWTTSGEALPVDLYQQFRQRLPEHILLNLYGSSEVAADATYFEAGDDTPDTPLRSVPIGRPIANLRIYVLDRYQQPVPIGIPGEIYVGGVGIARGYLNRPELTAARFIPDPFVTEPGARLFKTGDLGRYLANGNIEYLGRLDQQVKVRGFRIELGEIEAVLSQQTGVREAVVVAREDAPGDQRLVAYVVPEAETPLDTSALRQSLRHTLPDYMVPARFVSLDVLPLTPNGKVDRRALPAPDRTPIVADSTHIEPKSQVEQQLTEIWEDLLGVHPIGVQDDFFDLGGHSLLAAQLMARIQKVFGVNLPLSLLFERATIGSLACALEQPNLPERWSSLVAIRAKGTEPPFFCVHGIFGDVLFYADLMRYLDPDRPLFGLQARGLDGTQEPFTQIEPMAASYIEEIRAIQPEGPYYLGGYSSGGSVAYEMARQLAASGQDVALVALFDHPNPRSRYEKVAWSRAYPLRFLRNLAANVPYWFSMFWRSNSDRRFKLALQRAQMTRRALGALVKYRGHTGSEGDANDAGFMAHIMETPGLEYVHEWPEYRFRVLDAQRRALAAYVPDVYSGRVTLFRARRQPIFCAHDPTLGWGPMVLGGVEIIQVPGAHHSMLHDPYVQGLASALNASWSEVADTKNGAEEEAAVESAPANVSSSA